MTSMRAIALEKASGRPVLKDDHPEPVLHAPDQLLIRVLLRGVGVRGREAVPEERRRVIDPPLEQLSPGLLGR